MVAAPNSIGQAEPIITCNDVDINPATHLQRALLILKGLCKTLEKIRDSCQSPYNQWKKDGIEAYFERLGYMFLSKYPYMVSTMMMNPES